MPRDMTYSEAMELVGVARRAFLESPRTTSDVLLFRLMLNKLGFTATEIEDEIAEAKRERP